MEKTMPSPSPCGLLHQTSRAIALMTLLGLPGLAFAQEAAIRAVHVSGQGNRDLRLLAPVV